MLAGGTLAAEVLACGMLRNGCGPWGALARAAPWGRAWKRACRGGAGAAARGVLHAGSGTAARGGCGGIH